MKMKRVNSKVAVVGGLSVALLTALASANPAQAVSLTSFTGTYSLQIKDPDACIANNMIDFQVSDLDNNTTACGPTSSREWGTLGSGLITSAQILENGTDPLSLGGNFVQQMDLYDPGFKLNFLTGTETPITDVGGTPIFIGNAYRIDASGDGSIGVGDWTYTVTSGTSSRSSSGNLSLNWQGYLQEILSIANYGTASEVIGLTGPQVSTILSVISGTLSIDPNSLAVMGLDLPGGGVEFPGNPATLFCSIGGTPNGDGSAATLIDNLNPASDCAQKFNSVASLPNATLANPLGATPGNPQKTIIFSTQVPEPSAIGGLLAFGAMAAMGFGKRKQLKK